MILSAMCSCIMCQVLFGPDEPLEDGDKNQGRENAKEQGQVDGKEQENTKGGDGFSSANQPGGHDNTGLWFRGVGGTFFEQGGKVHPRGSVDIERGKHDRQREEVDGVWVGKGQSQRHCGVNHKIQQDVQITAKVALFVETAGYQTIETIEQAAEEPDQQRGQHAPNSSEQGSGKAGDERQQGDQSWRN